MKLKKTHQKKLLLLVVVVAIVLIALVGAKQTVLDALESGNLLWIDQGAQNENSALTGWYPVEEWEVETCTRGQTSDFEISDQAEEGAFSQSDLIIDTAITIQGTQHNIQPDYKEYELAWYIQPFNNELDYEIQYKVGDDWKTTPELQGKVAGPQNGDKGYFAWFGDYNITEIKIKSNESYLTVPMVQTE